MRTNKEILKLMLKHIDLLDAGLCFLVIHMLNLEIITKEERSNIDDYIHFNRPTAKSKLADLNNLTSGYFWTPYLVEPRVRWIKYHIKICKS